MTRLRIVAYTVQPVLMADDGDNLTPIPVNPLTIPASEWPHVVDLVAGAVEQLRSQVEGPPLKSVPRTDCGAKTKPCPDCGAHPGEYCDSSCSAHQGGRCAVVEDSA